MNQAIALVSVSNPLKKISDTNFHLKEMGLLQSINIW